MSDNNVSVQSHLPSLPMNHPMAYPGEQLRVHAIHEITNMPTKSCRPLHVVRDTIHPTGDDMESHGILHERTFHGNSHEICWDPTFSNIIIYASYGKEDPWILLRQLPYPKRTPVKWVMGRTHGERSIPLVFMRNTPWEAPMMESKVAG